MANADWQHDLSVIHVKLGDVMIAMAATSLAMHVTATRPVSTSSLSRKVFRPWTCLPRHVGGKGENKNRKLKSHALEYIESNDLHALAPNVGPSNYHEIIIRLPWKYKRRLRCVRMTYSFRQMRKPGLGCHPEQMGA